jgi:hypothetical protein
MSSTKFIRHQKDREAGITLARRRVLMTLATVESMGHIADGAFHPTRTTDVFYPRAEYPLRDAIWHARVLLQAYDYYLARCQEGGITLEQAEAAWQVHSSPAFEAELIEAEESFRANATHLIDEQILTHLGLPPHEAEVQVEDEGDDE